MAYNDHVTLRQQPFGKLRDINNHVEMLMTYQATLPRELYCKLDTFHADLAAAIEDQSRAEKARTRSPVAANIAAD
jgi:hypothetical protein